MTRPNAVSRRRFLARATGVASTGFLLSAQDPGRLLEAGRSSMPDTWQIGCYTRPWGKYDYRIALDAIAEAGYRYVGLMTTNSPNRLILSSQTSLDEARKVGKEVKDRDLTVASVWAGNIPVEESIPSGVKALKSILRNCAAAGGTSLVMGGTGKPELYEAYYTAIAECCGYAAEQGVGISLKPHGGLNATGPECRKAIEKVNHENFRIWYDAGNILYYSGGSLDPSEDAAQVDGLVVGMAIKDYQHPKNVAVTPGTGLVDFPAVLGRLQRGGFRGGPLVVETLAEGSLAQTLEEAKKARRFLEGLVEKA